MSRYENKYLVSAAQRNELIPLLRRRMRPDSHGSLAPGVYSIYSIYMDTDDLSSYHEKVDGLFQRCKVRLRHYHREKGPYFLEMKERVGAQIVKNRALLSDDEFHCCVNGKPVPDERGNAALRIFNRYVRHRHIRPQAIIGYLREAYENPLPGELRVTFDSNVTVQQTCWKGDDKRAEYRTLHPQWFILEIKFDLIMPQWIAHLVSEYSLWNEALCKYGWGINRLLKLGRIPEAAPMSHQPLIPFFSSALAPAYARVPAALPVPAPSRALAYPDVGGGDIPVGGGADIPVCQPLIPAQTQKPASSPLLEPVRKVARVTSGPVSVGAARK